MVAILSVVSKTTGHFDSQEVMRLGCLILTTVHPERSKADKKLDGHRILGPSAPQNIDPFLNYPQALWGIASKPEQHAFRKSQLPLSVLIQTRP